MCTRVGIAVLAILALGNQPANPQPKNSFNGFALVEKSGKIKTPADYRRPFTKPRPLLCARSKGRKPDAPNLRIAWSRRLLAAQQEFADGIVLVKEVFGTDHAQLTTGDAHWDKDTKVWFVLINGSKGRYPHNPLWGRRLGLGTI